MTHWIRSAPSLLALLTVIFTVPAFAQEDGAAPTVEEITAAWLASPHADASSEPFTHWDEDGEIPGRCAVCHSRTGVIDYINGPMATPGVIDHPVPLGTTVDCVACHSPGAAALTEVPFMSGVAINTFGNSAVCTVCHQGRASSATVEAAVAGLDDDVISDDLGFINIHYAASAATMMGSVTQSGYEYDGRTYRGQFTHVPNFSTCVDCHRPHSLEVSFEGCVACHQTAGSFAAIRMSPVDFDGDADVAEGIADPIMTLHGHLQTAIQDYAANVVGAPIIYADSFPYFFNDSDGDGAVSEGEAAYPNRYQSWTPRLVRAAYNYQFVAKDSAAYVHNPHYALQLLYDSLESLSLQVEVDMTELIRP